MGRKGDKRRKKKREKKKKKRAEAQQSRGSRPGLLPSKKSLDLSAAAEWPLHECYLSSNWNKWETEVQAVISRKHALGQIAAATFDIDMATGRILRSGGRADLSADTFMGLLVQGSSEENPLVLSEPALVVKLVTEAAAYAKENDSAPGKSYRKAAKLFGDVDPDRSSEEIRLGLEPTEDAPARPQGDEGLFASLKKRLFG